MPLTLDNELLERFAHHLDKAQNIVIISHMNPDGDAVGSLLASYHWLTTSFFAGRQQPAIHLLLPHPCPADARYLPGSDLIVDATSDVQQCEQLIADADLILGVDFNSPSRVQPLNKAIQDSQSTKMLVDHHHNQDDTVFGTIIAIPDLSSTCELLYWIFVQLIGDSSVTDPVARCLYHGINTDTGSFAYACEDASLYEATAALVKHPVNPADVHNRLFNSYSVKKMRILSFLLSQRFKIFESEHFAYLYLDADDLEQLQGTAEDLEGLVNYTLMMEPIHVGVFVKETDSKVRLSLRSKYDFDVNSFAKRHFGGGGHTQAAGATSPYDFQTTIKILEDNMLKELSTLYK